MVTCKRVHFNWNIRSSSIKLNNSCTFIDDKSMFHKTLRHRNSLFLRWFLPKMLIFGNVPFEKDSFEPLKSLYHWNHWKHSHLLCLPRLTFTLVSITILFREEYTRTKRTEKYEKNGVDVIDISSYCHWYIRLNIIKIK